MIIDQLKNISLYFGINENLTIALRYLQNINLSNISPGRYEIDGSKIYALIQEYETKPREKGLWEAHQLYTDVQYIARGPELIGYANVDNLKAIKYDADKDFLLLQGDGDFFEVQAGTFVIFMPQDAHMPGISVSVPQTVEKIVLKVCMSTE